MLARDSPAGEGGSSGEVVKGNRELGLLPEAGSSACRVAEGRTWSGLLEGMLVVVGNSFVGLL